MRFGKKQAFSVPFAVFRDRELKDAPRNLVFFLLMKSDVGGRCYVGYDELKAECGLASESTIAKAIRKIWNLGWLAERKRCGRRSQMFILKLPERFGGPKDPPTKFE
jgi:hypothetical protein